MQGPQEICDDINAIVEAKKREAAAERRIRSFVASKKRFSVRALSLMTHSRGAIIAAMGSHGKR
jgi:hypothetical protein